MAPSPPDAESLPTPSMLDDRYRIDALLAVGGMGAIYKGRHTKLKKTVAIKVLKRSLLDVPELVERFQREAVAASQIGHEGIVEVTDIGNSKDGDPFLVMEFLRGQDLAHCLRDFGVFRPATAARLCIEILEAMAAAHDKDIVHRDLKPENVFVAERSKDEKLKILDFGISRMPVSGDQSLRLTSTGLVMGTPYYMSPEQALGDRNVGHLADIYTIGVILYELVTGALPFRATNYNALLHQILEGEFEKPSNLANLSPEFEDLVLKGMAFKQEERFQSAMEFAEALRPYAESTPMKLLAHLDLAPDTVDELAAPMAPPLKKRLSTADLEESVAETQMLDSSGNLLPDPRAATEYDSSAEAPAEEAPKKDTLEPQVTPVHLKAPKRSSKGMWLGLLLVGGIAAGAPFLLGGSNAGSEENAAASAPAETPTEAKEVVPTIEPAAPTEVTLELAVAPDGARVFVDGKELTQHSVSLPSQTEQREVEVRLDGYVTQLRKVSGDKDHSLAFALVAQAAEPEEAVVPVEATVADTQTPPPKTRSKRRHKGSKPAVTNEPTETKTPPTQRKNRNRRFVEDSPYE